MSGCRLHEQLSDHIIKMEEDICDTKRNCDVARYNVSKGALAMLAMNQCFDKKECGLGTCVKCAARKSVETSLESMLKAIDDSFARDMAYLTTCRRKAFIAHVVHPASCSACTHYFFHGTPTPLDERKHADRYDDGEVVSPIGDLTPLSPILEISEDDEDEEEEKTTEKSHSPVPLTNRPPRCLKIRTIRRPQRRRRIESDVENQ